MSLIEVLVALVVLSFGVLAVVALQLVAKRNNADAGQRLVAAQLAYDMLERMRINANPTALQVYTGMLGAGFLGRNQVNAAATGVCTQGNQCDPSLLAIYDLRTWEDQLDGASETHTTGGTTTNAGGLVLATACIEPVGATVPGEAGIYAVTIAYKGAAKLSKNEDVACGLDVEVGGVKIYGDNDEYRRVIRVEGYIMPTV